MPQDETTTAAPEAEGGEPQRPKTVLVVDDDFDVSSAIRTVLDSKGYRVFTAPDGHAGLIAAQREQPDLLIVDMMMPKKSGFLVIEQIKRAKSPMKIIMITANEGSRHRAYAELLGVDGYIRKPFAMEKLLEEVKRLT
jgi:DNA-binding response OmpR family regulator